MATGYWQVIVPTGSDVTNLVTNPSGESGSTGYSGSGGTLTTTATYQRRGVYALSYTPTAGTTNGFYYNVSLTSGTTYYLSCDFLGAAGVGYTVEFQSTGSASKGTAATLTGTGDWQIDRPVAAFTADATTTFRLYFRKTNSASTAPFYVDGVLL